MKQKTNNYFEKNTSIIQFVNK